METLLPVLAVITDRPEKFCSAWPSIEIWPVVESPVTLFPDTLLVFSEMMPIFRSAFPLIPPTTLLFYQTALAVPLTFLYSAAFEGAASYHFNPVAIWGLLYQGLAVSGVAFTLWITPDCGVVCGITSVPRSMA